MLEKTSESPLDSKEIKSVNLKGGQLKLKVLKLKLQYFGHLVQTADSLGKSLMLGKIKGIRKRRCQRMRWLDSTIDELGLTPGDGEGQGGLACRSPWDLKESGTTGQLNNNKGEK